MFIATLFTTSKAWKQPKYLSTDRWIKNIRSVCVCVCVCVCARVCVYTMEYYSAIRRNEIMPFAAPWMDPEIVMLSEVSQMEKDNYYMILLIYGI